MRELGDIITALRKPMNYASKNSFANLDIVKDLEVHVVNLAKQALLLPLAPEKSSLIRKLAGNFAGFDSLDSSSKKIRIIDSLRILERIENDNQSPPSLEREVSVVEFLARAKELSTLIQFVKGVGPKWESILKKKGIETVEDALYFLPRTYEDRRNIKPISRLEVGIKETVLGEIVRLGVTPYKRRRKGIFEMVVGDRSGTITAKWFTYSYLKKRFKKGDRVILSGEIKVYRFQKEIHHPDIEVVEDMTDSLNFTRIVPVYSETEGLYQKTMRKIMKNIVDRYSDSLFSAIPSHIRGRQDLMELPEAIKRVHFPEPDDNFSDLVSGGSPCHRTIVFDEFFFLELGLALKKKGVTTEKGISFTIPDESKDRLLKSLPFNLTEAQKRVIATIENDMERSYPMNRLIQGDVGSGKTVVALISAFIAVENGYQVSIMTPTEILAEQHFLNIHRLATSFGVKTVLLTSSVKKAQKDKILNAIRDGDVDIVIGTHAIIQETVE
ncbi:MAG: DEAD/DEAH box helicase, partial [Pseudomonadota bacterium]